ncbi:MAG: hypothetical protein NVS4B6_25240 [Mycobacterium sp.]
MKGKAATTGLAAVMAALAVSAPLAHADPGDKAAAEQAVVTAYNTKQPSCAPHARPQLRSIDWLGFRPGSWGQGHVIDADSLLGGEFETFYDQSGQAPIAGAMHVGPWAVRFDFCP